MSLPQSVDCHITNAGLEKGLLKILKHMRPLFPETNSAIKITALFTDTGEERPLSYQGRHQRVFGLTGWYRRNNAQAGDIVRISKDDDKYSFAIEKKATTKERPAGVPPLKLKKPVGEPINFRGLVYSPVNENGVIFLFGLVAKDLGIMVEGIQEAFPDAFGRRLVSDRYYPVDIEFKFKSSGYKNTYFKEKLMCDILVCWEHDWQDHPREIEVIELKSKIRELQKQTL